MRRLAALVEDVWPPGAVKRDLAGLPPSVVDVVRRPRGGGRFARSAGRLDRALPGWVEIGAEAVLQAASDGLGPDLTRVSALLARRPLRHPEPLLRALDACADDSETRFWLLVALAGTDTAEVRAAWLRQLVAPDASDRAAWFAFGCAVTRGWLTWPQFRECLSEGRVFAALGRDYRTGLARLGLAANPTFAKWYRQLIYEVAHQPDASLSLRAGGWIRDFPGVDYLHDALDALERDPASWWSLHMVRWASLAGSDRDALRDRLRKCSPSVVCLASLVRRDLCEAAGDALGAAEHGPVVHWLKTTGPAARLDLGWLEGALRPWSEVAGEAMTLAAGALCSVDPPSDFEGPEHEALRRRAFLRHHLLPEFARVMENMLYVQALRGTHLSLVCEQANRGLPAALRALALCPEQVEQTAPIVFRQSREGNRLARQAAREALEAIRARAGLDDLAQLEKRVDLASAWSDAGLEGKAARVWWDVGGHQVRLSVARGKVGLETYSGPRRLASVPAAVRGDAQYPAIRQARADLAKGYRYFRRRLEESMVEGSRHLGRDFGLLLSNPVVRSLVSRIVLLVDGAPVQWSPENPLDDCQPPRSITEARHVAVAHPVDLLDRQALDHWQQQIVEQRIAQPFKQVFREVYLLGDDERGAEASRRFAAQPLVARRAFALLRSRGYSPRSGDAVKESPGRPLRAHIVWAGPEEDAGRRLAQRDAAEPVTSGAVWFEDGDGKRMPLSAIAPIVLSETLRDADLVVSRAAAGELGFTSEETRGLRATLIRYLARAMDLTSVYVGDDDTHVLIEGRRAMYRVHLGSGSVLLEYTRRSLDLGSLAVASVETLVAESIDSSTARIIGIVVALSSDETITDQRFLDQLA